VLIRRIDPDLAVDGDPARLSQVFANLLTNAAKYTDPGGTVTLEASEDSDRVVVRVRDTGRGISAEMLPSVFDLFVQERQNLDRSRGGLGLGLAIVRSLVQLHGGTVEAASPGPGRGSTFTVTLPAAKPVIAEPQPEIATSKASVANGLKVLIVDDNEDAAMLLSEFLTLRGITTYVAHDGSRALAAAADFGGDVALLDIGLPGMDGFELARRLRALPGWSDAKLFALTGYGQESDRARAKDAGFDEHLIKPVNLDLLDRMLAGVAKDRLPSR